MRVESNEYVVTPFVAAATFRPFASFQRKTKFVPFSASVCRRSAHEASRRRYTPGASSGAMRNVPD